MDSAAFSIHFRSLAGSDSGGYMKTPTGVHLSLEEKTPTQNTIVPNPGSSTVLTAAEKPFSPETVTRPAPWPRLSETLMFMGQGIERIIEDRGLQALADVRHSLENESPNVAWDSFRVGRWVRQLIRSLKLLQDELYQDVNHFTLRSTRESLSKERADVWRNCDTSVGTLARSRQDLADAERGFVTLREVSSNSRREKRTLALYRNRLNQIPHSIDRMSKLEGWANRRLAALSANIKLVEEELVMAHSLFSVLASSIDGLVLGLISILEKPPSNPSFHLEDELAIIEANEGFG